MEFRIVKSPVLFTKKITKRVFAPNDREKYKQSNFVGFPVARDCAGSKKVDFLEFFSKIRLLTRDHGSKTFYGLSIQVTPLILTSEHFFGILNFPVTFLLPIRRKLRIYDFRPLEGPHKIFFPIIVIRRYKLVI